MIEITFTREELRHLYEFLLKNHLQVKQSVIDKYELLGDLECLDPTLDEEWQNKLWYDDPEDEYTIAVKRDPKMWNRQTIAELKTLIGKLEAK
jgi:hypothetical protein